MSDLNELMNKKWIDCSPHELLVLAQDAFDRNVPEAAKMYLAAAQVQAIAGFEWTLTERFAPLISNAIWEGMRTR